MIPSAFTPPDLLELSSETPLAERIYDAGVAATGGQFDLTVGASRVESFIFSEALQDARVQQALRRASRQGLVSDADELLWVLCEVYRYTPAPGETVPETRAELARRAVRRQTWTKVRIEALLTELLGDDFIAYRPTPLGEEVRWPVDLGDSPMNLQLPTVPRKIVRLLEPVSLPGGPDLFEIEYELVTTPQAGDSVRSSDLQVGDVLVVEPNIMGISEVVEVQALRKGLVPIGQTPPKFLSGEFSRPHTDGCLAFTQSWPMWLSSKRHSLVVLTPEAATNPTKRGRVHDWMRRMTRGCSTWDICSSEDGISTGDFIIGESLLGSQTIVDTTI